MSSPLCCEAGRKLSTKSDFLFRLLVTIVAYLTPVSRSLFLAIRSLLVLSGNLRKQFDSSLEMTCSCHIFFRQLVVLPAFTTISLVAKPQYFSARVKYRSSSMKMKITKRLWCIPFNCKQSDTQQVVFWQCRL